MIVTAPPARLGPRLRAVLQMCPAEGPVADVGSGHGRLAHELAGRLPEGQVFATEVRPGPIHELRRLLGEGSPVTVVEGWGLRPLAGLGIRGAAIAGMGGRTVAAILDADQAVVAEMAWICLQPMQRVERLTAWIGRQRGWSVRSAVAVERGHVYHTFLLDRR